MCIYLKHQKIITETVNLVKRKYWFSSKNNPTKGSEYYPDRSDLLTADLLDSSKCMGTMVIKWFSGCSTNFDDEVRMVKSPQNKLKNISPIAIAFRYFVDSI